MPYTKAQLKENEYYERVLEASRREQINIFVKEERDFVASGSNAAATKTLRMKTGEFLSIPEIEDNPAQKVVIPNKTYYVTEDAEKFVDKEIKELLNNNPVKDLTVSEFFEEYEKLREVISSEGSRDSHRYIVDTSKTYIDTDDDEIQKLKQRLQDEIDRLLSIQANLQETIQESADDTAIDAKFAEYQAEMLRYPNTDVAYTRAEWDDKGQPVAAEGNGHPKLRFERQAQGNHKGKTDLKTNIYCTYYGRFAKKNRKLRKGNGPVIISVKALGDPTISYQWLASDNGLPIKAAWGNKGSNFTGEDTATLTVNMPNKYKNSFGPMVKCKIRDGSGETTSHAVDISRRSVNAGS
jgi:hypothetical protein